jgi:hypothetical protein
VSELDHCDSPSPDRENREAARVTILSARSGYCASRGRGPPPARHERQTESTQRHTLTIICPRGPHPRPGHRKQSGRGPSALHETDLLIQPHGDVVALTHAERQTGTASRLGSALQRLHQLLANARATTRSTTPMMTSGKGSPVTSRTSTGSTCRAHAAPRNSPPSSQPPPSRARRPRRTASGAHGVSSADQAEGHALTETPPSGQTAARSQ